MVWQNSSVFNLVALFNGGSSSSPLQSIGAGATVTPVSMVDVSQFQSYDLSMAFVDTSQATAGHSMSVTVTVKFFDDLISNIPVYQEVWNPWVVVALNANNNIIADGPMHGHYMSITINNPGVGPVTLQYLNLFGSPRNLQVSDWRQNYANHIADASRHLIPNANGSGYENSLADTGGGVSLTASTNYMLPCSLYAGPVWWSVEIGGNVVVAAIALVDVGTPQMGSGNVGFFSNIFRPPVSSSSVNSQFVFGSAITPRSACAWLVNMGGTGGTVAIKQVAQQGP